MKPHLALRHALALILVLSSAVALGQAFPSRPIRVISTFGPGSPADGLVRQISLRMSESMGQPVVVEVQTGASGVVGGQYVARAAPDGHTLLVTVPTTLVATPFLLKTRPYDPLKDFTPITAALDGATCIMVAASLPVNSVRELIAYAKANPGKVPYGSNGIGGTYHMEWETIKRLYDLDMTHVPYKGGSEAMMAAVNGQIPVSFAPLAAALPHAKSGRIKVLAILDSKRYPGAPDIPAMSEQVPDYEKMPTGSFYYGPGGMPTPIVRRLYEEIRKGVNAPEVVERMRQVAFFSTVNTPEEFAIQTRRHIEVAARGIKAAGLQPE